MKIDVSPTIGTNIEKLEKLVRITNCMCMNKSERRYTYMWIRIEKSGGTLPKIEILQY